MFLNFPNVFLHDEYSKTNIIKWQYYEIHNIITKSRFGNIQIINIMMYVSIFYV